MQIIIVGDGKVGLTLTQILTAEDHDVTVIDSNSKVLERTQDEYDAAIVHGHGASRAVLVEAGVEKADLLIAATSSDEINLLSCLIARKMGCKHTIARVRNTEYVEDIELLSDEMGLSFAINPEENCAHEVYRLLQFPSFLAREPFARGRVEVVGFRLQKDSPLVNVPLFDLYRTAQVRVLVCAVDRDGEVIIPNGSFVLQADDELFVTAAGEDLATLIKNLNLTTDKVTQVTIVGGGLLAYYLTQLLTKSGIRVKIIERDPARCQVLCDLLPDADIVEGDGTEEDILAAEGIERSDALVALTGIDEENILLSMYAKQLGVKTTVTKCNRDQYSAMFRKIGISSIVSPKTNCAEEIVRYVRAMDNSVGGEMITMHKIAGGKVEALEFLADDTSRVLGIPLMELNLKKGLLITCINRGRKTIIPSGSSVIHKGDSVMVAVVSGQRIYSLNDILAD